MKKYDNKAWARLGRAVYQARLRAGFADTKEWSAQVGRSTRMLLGLERGEPVGAGTLDRVVAALGMGPEWPYEVLEGEPSASPPPPPDETVSGADHDDDEVFEIKMRRPEGVSVEEWKRMKADWEAELQFKLNRAARER